VSIRFYINAAMINAKTRIRNASIQAAQQKKTARGALEFRARAAAVRIFRLPVCDFATGRFFARFSLLLAMAFGLGRPIWSDILSG